MTNTAIKSLPTELVNLKELTILEGDILPLGNTDKIKKSYINLDANPTLEEVDVSSTEIWTPPDGLYVKSTVMCKLGIFYYFNTGFSFYDQRIQV